MKVNELRQAHRRLQTRLIHEEDLVDAILAKLSLFIMKEQRRQKLTPKQVIILDSIVNLGSYKKLWV
jgi:hypothetical protein